MWVIEIQATEDTTKSRLSSSSQPCFDPAPYFGREHHNEKMDFGGGAGRAVDRSPSAILRVGFKFEQPLAIGIHDTKRDICCSVSGN